MKWLLIGRWRETSFPIWSVAYARFWTVKALISSSPFAYLPGTPLYNAFLKALGARIHWSAVVLGPPPICTDLVEIGAQTVVGREVRALGYKAVRGRIVTGPIHIGARAFIGDGCVLDVRTRLEDDTDLAFASAMYEGQTARSGGSYHGCPAEPAEARFRGLDVGELSVLRRTLYVAGQLGMWILVYGPLLVAAEILVVGREGESGMAAWIPDDTLAAMPLLVAWGAVAYVGSLLLGLAVVAAVPRAAWLFLRPR
jgi:non-ribosomal peptide synthetase-like protein